jgi:hypothetical protein
MDNDQDDGRDEHDRSGQHPALQLFPLHSMTDVLAQGESENGGKDRCRQGANPQCNYLHEYGEGFFLLLVGWGGLQDVLCHGLAVLVAEDGTQLGAAGAHTIGPASLVVAGVLAGVDAGGTCSSQLGAGTRGIGDGLSVAVLQGWHRASSLRPDRSLEAVASNT